MIRGALIGLAAACVLSVTLTVSLSLSYTAAFLVGLVLGGTLTVVGMFVGEERWS